MLVAAVPVGQVTRTSPFFNPHLPARYRLQSQFAGLTRLQLDEVGRERQVQQQGRQRAEALAERSVEIAQAMVPLAGALARGGG